VAIAKGRTLQNPILGVCGVGDPDDHSSRDVWLGKAKAVSAFPDLCVNPRNPDNLRTIPAIFLTLELLTRTVASSRKRGREPGRGRLERSRHRSYRDRPIDTRHRQRSSEMNLRCSRAMRHKLRTCPNRKGRDAIGKPFGRSAECSAPTVRRRRAYEKARMPAKMAFVVGTGMQRAR
jgi:hypothetical protein